MELGRLYFFTATITKWRKLLNADKYKDIIIGSLLHLAKQGKIEVHCFVIMPNHVHIIWKMIELNGKEMPHASFMKFTSHQMQKDLRVNSPKLLEQFRVETETRKYHFWQRDSLAIVLYTPKVIYQKLDYIHKNPCVGKWELAESPAQYKYSSASFYETEIDEFGFLTHISECT